MTTEYRAGNPAEIESQEGLVKVQGYAAVFNSRANIGNSFIEVIQPGAFTDAIKRDDIVFLIDHAGLPLARTGSKTLEVLEDDHGLLMRSELEGTDPDVMRIKPKMERGDLSKMSFGFYPEIQEWDDSGDIPVRSLIQVGLDDVSIVTRPAYDSTEIALRSLAEFRSKKPKVFDMGRTKRRMKLNLAERLILMGGSR